MLQFREQNSMMGERFHAKSQPLTFSEESVSLVLTPGEIREGSFTIYGHGGENVNGYVLPSGLSMTCLTDTFSGSGDTVNYRFDGTPFHEGDTVDGYFRIISNQGEYRLAYNVRFTPAVLQSSLGPVRNLFHFQNLAKTNWKEALDLFYNPDFENVFTASESDELGLYRGLCGRRGNEQNMEEFLISAGKKQPIEYLPSKKDLFMELPAPEEEALPLLLDIARSGWGYTKLEIRTDGTFISADRSELYAADFGDGNAHLHLTIFPQHLHQGKNMGRIRLISPFSTVEIPVTIRYCMGTALRILHHKEKKQLVCQMMKYFERLRAKKMKGKDFAMQMGTLIRRLSETDRNNPFWPLYRIHYLLTLHKNEDALWELQELNKRLAGDIGQIPEFSIAQYPPETDVAYSYRLYLTVLCAESVEGREPIETFAITQDAVRCIEEALKRNPDNWWIAWLLLYASDGFRRKPSQAWEIIRDQYARGCRSPILYIEAYQLINANPAILYTLSPFELQVLYYAARHQILTDAVMTQVNYLARRHKGFSVMLYRVLACSYESDSLGTLRDETLESICSLLIRGNMTDSRYFTWYQKGIEKQLQITRLFEYYMLSMPDGFDGEIPRMVILYFAYQSTLPYERSAILYRYLLQHREEFPDVFAQYAPQIASFTLDQMMQHHINPDLGILYEQYLLDAIPGAYDMKDWEENTAETEHARTSADQGPDEGSQDQAEDRTAMPPREQEPAGTAMPQQMRVLPVQDLTDEIAALAVPASFMVKVHTDHPLPRRVILINDKCRGEQYFPLKGGTAWVPVYGEENHLFFEDNQGNRYASSITSTCTRMMNYARLAQPLSMYRTSSFGFDVYLSGMADRYYPIGKSNAGHYLRLAQSQELLETYRQEIRQEVLNYYAESDSVRELDEFLANVDPAGMTAQSRGEIIRYMAMRGLNDKALSWISRYSTFNVDGNTLMRLCSQYMHEEEAWDDRNFSEIVHETFLKGKYDGDLLDYMGRCFDGLTAELEEIREAMEGFGADDYFLTRRMLIQMLYTGESVPQRPEIISCFMKNGADESLLGDVLAQSAHFYFVSGERMGDQEFDVIEQYGRNGVPLVDICRIAWLKDRSERSGSISDAQLEVTHLFLQDLMSEGMVFPFFRQFIGIFPELQAYADETLVEYRARRFRQSAHIRYHYALEKNGVRDPYAVKDMRLMYEGVYVTGFILFFGEQMHYYITDDEEEKNVVESGTIGQDARIPEESDDRFGMINRISMLTVLGKDEEALDKIGKYAQRAFLAGRLFSGGRGNGNAV